MSRRILNSILTFFVILNISSANAAEEAPIFKTKYTTIHYAQPIDLSDFIWRLGGSRIEFSTDTALASNRVDRVVERVKTILGMWPRTDNINIYLKRGELEGGRTAYYDNKTGDIIISVDNTSDGVFAHEMAHAIINRYFAVPPPSKMQEILTQYVDKYLWNDY